MNICPNTECDKWNNKHLCGHGIPHEYSYDFCDDGGGICCPTECIYYIEEEEVFLTEDEMKI